MLASKKIGVVGSVAAGLGSPTPFGQASGLPLASNPDVSMKYTVFDAVAAAALGQVDNVVEHGKAVEIGVLADFVDLLSELGHVEAADRRRQARIRLPGERYMGARCDLRAGAEDDAVRLRVAAVTGV